MNLQEIEDQDPIAIARQFVETQPICASGSMAFGQCEQMSFRLAKQLRSHGYDARVIQLTGHQGEPLRHANLKWWEQSSPGHWVHYVVLVDGQYLDPTWRQFEPEGPKLKISNPDEIDRDWDDQTMLT